MSIINPLKVHFHNDNSMLLEKRLCQFFLMLIFKAIGLSFAKSSKQALCLLLFFLITPLASQAKPALTLPNGIAAGDATATSVVLWTRSTQAGAIEFRYWRSNTSPRKADTIQVQSDGLNPVKIEIKDLLPGRRYTYRITDSSGASVKGTFRMPREASNHYGLRFGVSGDSRGDNAPYYSMKNIPRKKLDFIVNLGDTVYADVESTALPGVKQARTLAEFHAKHNEIYSAKNGLNAMATARASTLFYSMIDDHEVTNDFAGGESPANDARFAAETEHKFINETELYKNGMRAFMDFNPIREIFYPAQGDPLTDARPNYYRYQPFAKDAAIFITDARSFRNQALTPPLLNNDADIARFRTESFAPERTLLGQRQFDQLLTDLTDAQTKGITWKFVCLPEPIQNLSHAAAADRYEGYAAERSRLLRFIEENNIDNVVFIAADIHGTVINNLTYQESPGSAQIPTHSFEVTTGPWAYDAPLAATAIEYLKDYGLVSDFEFNLYQHLPTSSKETLFRTQLDAQLQSEGYDPTGLKASLINARLKRGGYTATHTYGWTEFAISAKSQRLRVTTYGIQPNTTRSPNIVSRFIVHPTKH